MSTAVIDSVCKVSYPRLVCEHPPVREVGLKLLRLPRLGGVEGGQQPQLEVVGSIPDSAPVAGRKCNDVGCVWTLGKPTMVIVRPHLIAC